MFRKILATPYDLTLTLLRVVLGTVFLAHGAQLMLGWFGGNGYSGTMGFFTQQMGVPAPLAFLAITSQFFGGLGLLLGALARFAAFGIAIDMLVAITTVHLPFGFFMNWYGQQKGEGFEYHLLVIAIAAVIMLRGAGAWSVDRLLSASQSGQVPTAAATRLA